MALPITSSLFSSSPRLENPPSKFTLFHYLNDKNIPFSLSTLPRKLLCQPPHGKYVREDYLVTKLSAEEVQELVKGERNVPLIIDFYATWCGPCVLRAQLAVAVEYENNALIVKVDTDNEYEFARDMQVRGLPTLFLSVQIQIKMQSRLKGLFNTDDAGYNR